MTEFDAKQRRRLAMRRLRIHRAHRRRCCGHALGGRLGQITREMADVAFHITFFAQIRKQRVECARESTERIVAARADARAVIASGRRLGRLRHRADRTQNVLREQIRQQQRDCNRCEPGENHAVQNRRIAADDLISRAQHGDRAELCLIRCCGRSETSDPVLRSETQRLAIDRLAGLHRGQYLALLVRQRLLQFAGCGSIERTRHERRAVIARQQKRYLRAADLATDCDSPSSTASATSRKPTRS